MASGVYQISFTKSDKKYIGSAVNLDTRKRSHLSHLRKGHGVNLHLQNAFSKYGEDTYRFRVLLYCDPENCVLYEQMVLDSLTPERIYNIRIKASSNLGLKSSEETRKKVIEALKKRRGEKHPGTPPHSEEHKRNMRHPNSKPKTFTPESHAAWRAKLSATTKAYWQRKHSEERNEP